MTQRRVTARLLSPSFIYMYTIYMYTDSCRDYFEDSDFFGIFALNQKLER